VTWLNRMFLPEVETPDSAVDPVLTTHTFLKSGRTSGSKFATMHWPLISVWEAVEYLGR
jgi:hypothetical protein